MTDVLIICGGTGGHLSPGIAVAEVLQARNYTSLLCISQKSIDSAIIAKYNRLKFESFSGKGFSGGLWGRLLFFYQLVFSLPKIAQIILVHKPKVLLLFGGYLSVGFGLLGVLFNRTLVLHEANAKPGKAVRLLQRFAKRVYLPLGVNMPSIKKAKLGNHGYPVRKEIAWMEKAAARSQIGIAGDGPLLVFIGGSQGAEVFNKWVMNNFNRLTEDGISIYCITGLNNGLESYDVSVNKRGESVTINMVPFSDQMSAVLSAADLVVSRAGAGAIAEIIRCQVPSILIPYPYAADNHQLYNARMHETLGGGIVLEQSNMDRLNDEIKALIHNHRLLEQIQINLANLERQAASELIVNDLESMVDLKKNATQNKAS